VSVEQVEQPSLFANCFGSYDIPRDTTGQQTATYTTYSSEVVRQHCDIRPYPVSSQEADQPRLPERAEA